ERIRITGAHKAPVTSVQFLGGQRLVTAGGDRRLVVWTLDGDKASVTVELDRRSGEVDQLGVSPDGQHMLFDEGAGVPALTVSERPKIVGTLKTATGAANFSTMALYSPDGKIILTNGAAPGRLQLWRAPAPGVRQAELRRLVWTKATA